MRHAICIVTLGILIISCNRSGHNDSPAMSRDKECLSQKNEIQKAFNLKDISKTIELFIPFRDCYKDETAYLNKLGLLYHTNHQDSLATRIFGQLLQKLTEEKSMPVNDLVLHKGTIYMMLEEKDSLKTELEKIDISDLTESQQKKLEYLQLYANEGEFITSNVRMEFELFE